MGPPGAQPEKVSDQLERWFRADQPHTLGSLIEMFGEKSFAVVFVVLMAVPALPLPTGGVTHVFEVITMLISLELIAGRRTIWLPERWKKLDLGASGERFTMALVKRIRWIERFSRPRGSRVLRYLPSRVAFGLIAFALALTAFLAPPFSGLDTIPALGVVVVSLGVLLEDLALAFVGVLVGIIGVVVVFLLGSLVVNLVQQIF
jgi:hypothetical protein